MSSAYELAVQLRASVAPSPFLSTARAAEADYREAKAVYELCLKEAQDMCLHPMVFHGTDHWADHGLWCCVDCRLWDYGCAYANYSEQNLLRNDFTDGKLGS